MRTLDRDTLEQVILPAYAARADIKTVLFVGCAWYTRHYEGMLPGRVYWTIDPDRGRSASVPAGTSSPGSKASLPTSRPPAST